MSASDWQHLPLWFTTGQTVGMQFPMYADVAGKASA